MRAAAPYDERTLRAELRKAQTAGKLNKGLARAVAVALLEGELARSRAESGVDFTLSLDGCSTELHQAIDRRSQTHDAVGGAALLLLVEDGRELKRARSHESDPLALFRVASARALTSPDDALRRNMLYSDPDERVRRAVLEAAWGSVTIEEFAAVAETARLDPDPLSRSKALRLLGTIDDPRVLPALLDRYTGANERQRLSVLEGLSENARFRPEARAELMHIAQSESGLLRLGAALLMIRSRSDPKLSGEDEEFLHNVIYDFARAGSPAEQILALSSLPWRSNEGKKVLNALALSAHEEVRVAALTRALDDPQQAKTAESKLLAIAQKDSPAARAAQTALAAQKNEKVLPFVLRTAQNQESNVRLGSAEALLDLDRWDHAGLILGDHDPRVRLRLACSMLSRN